MAFKKYLTADNVHAQLDGNVNTTQTQIVFKNGSNVPTAGNWIATLVQYGQDGFPSKWEKVLVTSVAGQVLTVQRAYDGSTAQTFNDNDYVFLNVVSEIIKDIQDRIDELGTSLGNYQLTSQKNQANGYAGLGADGKIDVGQIPAIKSHEFLTVTNAAARYALTTSQVQLGDEVLETSTGETYVLIASDPSQAGSWLFKSDTTPTWSSIAAKPTTIAGFSITDAYTKTEIDTSLGNYYTKTEADARFVHLTGAETIAGVKTFTSSIINTDFNNKNILYLQNSSGVLRWHISHNTDFHLTESGVADYRFVVKQGGNVGIGGDPAYKFDVNHFPGGSAIVARIGRMHLLDENSATGIPGGFSSEGAGFGYGIFSPSGTFKVYVGGKTAAEKKFEVTAGKFIYANEWETELFYGPRSSLLSSQIDMGWRFRDSTGAELFRIRTAAKDVCVGQNLVFRKDIATGGSQNTMTIGSRYELSGVVHASGGHKMQLVWGDINTNYENATSDGGWGFIFGSTNYAFAEMINHSGSNRFFVGNYNQNNCFVIRGDANDANATSLLNNNPNKTMIISQTGNQVRFYWKDMSGSKWVANLTGSAF